MPRCPSPRSRRPGRPRPPRERPRRHRPRPGQRRADRPRAGSRPQRTRPPRRDENALHEFTTALHHTHPSTTSTATPSSTGKGQGVAGQALNRAPSGVHCGTVLSSRPIVAGRAPRTAPDRAADPAAAGRHRRCASGSAPRSSPEPRTKDASTSGLRAATSTLASPSQAAESAAATAGRSPVEDHFVRLEGFHAVPADTLTLVGAQQRRLALPVVPPEASPTQLSEPGASSDANSPATPGPACSNPVSTSGAAGPNRAYGRSRSRAEPRRGTLTGQPHRSSPRLWTVNPRTASPDRRFFALTLIRIRSPPDAAGSPVGHHRGSRAGGRRLRRPRTTSARCLLVDLAGRPQPTTYPSFPERIHDQHSHNGQFAVQPPCRPAGPARAPSHSAERSLRELVPRAAPLHGRVIGGLDRAGSRTGARSAPDAHGSPREPLAAARRPGKTLPAAAGVGSDPESREVWSARF